MKVEFFFTDIDNSLYTTGQGSVVMEINADDEATAIALANRLKKMLEADHYIFQKELV